MDDPDLEDTMAEAQPERHTLSDGTTVTIRTATAGDAPATFALFRSILEEGRYTVDMGLLVKVHPGRG